MDGALTRDELEELIEVEKFCPTTPSHPVARCRWCLQPFVFLFKQPKLDSPRPGGHWFCSSIVCAWRQAQHAMVDHKGIMAKCPWIYVPSPVGVELHECTTPNLLLGGAAGGTKSHGLRWHLYSWCDREPGYRALLMRETLVELENTQLLKMEQEAKWLRGAEYVPSRRRMEYDNGSIIIAGHCQHKSDLKRHLSTEWDEIAIDEASNFAPKILVGVSSRARSESLHGGVRARGGGWVRLGTNPGGPSSLYLESFYITRKPDMRRHKKYHPEHYGFIPAFVEDNPYLEEDYIEKRLDPLDPDAYEQLRNGRWGVASGAFFGKFSRETHLREINL